jgi:cytochrome c553
MQSRDGYDRARTHIFRTLLANHLAFLVSGSAEPGNGQYGSDRLMRRDKVPLSDACNLCHHHAGTGTRLVERQGIALTILSSTGRLLKTALFVRTHSFF